MNDDRVGISGLHSPRKCLVQDCNRSPLKKSDFCLVHVVFEKKITPREREKVIRGWVYFVLAVGTERVKIGKTRNLKARMRGMTTDCPVETLTLAAVPCVDPDEMEARVHQALEPHRAKGEWFALDDEVVDFAQIASEKGEYGLIDALRTRGIGYAPANL